MELAPLARPADVGPPQLRRHRVDVVEGGPGGDDQGRLPQGVLEDLHPAGCLVDDDQRRRHRPVAGGRADLGVADLPVETERPERLVDPLVEDDEGVLSILKQTRRRAAFHSEDEFRLRERLGERVEGDPSSHPVLILTARKNGPGLGQGIDSCFPVGVRTERRSVIEEATQIPVAIPGRSVHGN